MNTEPTTIMDDLAAIAALDAENRRLESAPLPPCYLCEQGRPCWFHRQPQWREMPDEG